MLIGHQSSVISHQSSVISKQMLSDIRLTLRWLSRSPGLATVAVGTLAGAIAGGVVTFAVVDR